MKNIYEKASNLHIMQTYVYTKSSDTYAYKESGNTNKITADELIALFHSGCLIVSGDIEYKPVSIDVKDGVATLTYIKADTTTATTAVLALLHSSEYSAS